MKPLAGLHIVEFEGLGPGPLCGRMLADFGARVTLVVRPGPAVVADLLAGAAADDAAPAPSARSRRPLAEGKSELALNLKDPAGIAQALALLADADGLIEGNRPGVMERLGLGPAQVAAVNPRLVYGRMTGWGQDGPLAQAAGHDLNYVALSGMLSLAPGHGIPPTLGDGAGALGLAFGMVSGLLQARNSGKGCVVDAAIMDVVAMLGGIAQWIAAAGGLGGTAPSAFHDSPFYDTYRCADGGHITVGALEPQFYALLLQKLGVHDVDPGAQYDTSTWPALKERFSALFASQPRSHWCALLEGTDACFAPVLSLAEAALRVRPGVRFGPLGD